MKTPILAICIVLFSGLVAPALAQDISAAKSRAACQAGGGVWDQQMDRCVRSNRRKACHQMGGIWHEGTSTCRARP